MLNVYLDAYKCIYEFWWFQIELALIKDAFDAVKYILRQLLFEDDFPKDQYLHQQECSWSKMLTLNSYVAFKQHVGERLLDISRMVIISRIMFSNVCCSSRPRTKSSLSLEYNRAIICSIFRRIITFFVSIGSFNFS